MRTFKIIGHQRGGHHAIANWVLAGAEQPVHYQNDVHQKRGGMKGTPKSLPSITVALKQTAATVAYTFERQSVDQAIDFSAGEDCTTIITLRDPYNTCSSFLERYRDLNRGKEGFPLSSLINRYIELHGTICKHPDFTVILYDKWLTSATYRTEIAKKLKIKNIDSALSRVPDYGNGSSFHNQDFDNRAHEDTYLERWRHYNDREKWHTFVTHPKIDQIAKDLFPEIRSQIKFLPPEERTVLMGPFIGEFGVELMTWQTWCRYLARTKYKNQRVEIATRKDRFYLYQDFADDFLDVEIPSVRNANGFAANVPPRYRKKKDRIRHYADVVPSDDQKWEKVREGMRSGKFDEYYHEYGSDCEAPGPERKKQLLLHCRDKGNRKGANTPPQLWSRIVEQLQSEGWELKTIGHPQASFALPGVDDLRGADLPTLATEIRTSQAVIGVCSGPMHFAMLSGTPVISWGSPSCKRNLFQINPFQVRILFKRVVSQVDLKHKNIPSEFILRACREIEARTSTKETTENENS